MSDPKDFTHFELDQRLIDAVTEMGYTTPTPIQAKAIPLVMQGHDVMGAAQTGTGKTAGFSLPIIQRLLPLASTSVSPARHPVRALVLAPTRELADQVADNIKRYVSKTPLRCAVVFGGVDMEPQTQALRAGVEILVATPGRLLDHLQMRNTALGQVQAVVLDEADRMLDMGFLPDISRILSLLPAQRQSLMFSATFSEEIKKLAGNFLRDPILVEVARRNATVDSVELELYQVHESEKTAALVALLRARQLKQVLVFVNSKIGCRRLARELQKEGINAGEIHGDKSQDERMKALEAFKAGAIDILVATDVAARGLDITELPTVINYDVPYVPEDYVHRIGRTGRAGATGLAMTIATSGEMKQIAAIERLIKRTLEPRTVVPVSAPRRPRRDAGASFGPEPARITAAAPTAPTAPTAAAVPAAIDEFFFRPYEPSAAPALALTGSGAGAGSDPADALPAAPPAAASAAERTVRAPRLGALLGGRRRPGS